MKYRATSREVQRSQRIRRSHDAIEHTFRERGVHLAHGHVDRVGIEVLQDGEQF